MTPHSSDDEDWLYRRGRYAEGGATAPSDADATRIDQPRDAAPTPVGHYGRPAGARAPRPTGERPPAPQRRPRRRRHPGRVALLVLVLALAYLIGVPLLTWPSAPRVDAMPTGDRPADTPGHVFVLAGSDARDGLSAEDQARLGTGNDAGRRADTIMVLYVPPSGRAALVSVPRDSYVAIPGHGRNKLNAAYSFGGPKLLVQTIEQNTKLRVDGFVEVGFGGFANVVDALGGIEMCPPKAIKDKDSSLDIPAGCQQMDGVTALGYVRMRKADPEGDLGRAKRQREMVSALAKKALSPLTVVLPWRWWGVNWAGSRAVSLGGIGPGGAVGLASGALRVGTGQADTLSVPVGNPDAQTPAGSSVLWNTKKAEAMFQAMARGEGDLAPYA